jgi:predicted DNA-binding WGR domain protein
MVHKIERKINLCLKHLNDYKVIRLKAVKLDQNINRYYTIYIHKNLFQGLTVSLYYGRIGRGGQLKQFYFAHIHQIEKFLKPLLKKRLNAKKRIGVNYKLIVNV